MPLQIKFKPVLQIWMLLAHHPISSHPIPIPIPPYTVYTSEPSLLSGSKLTPRPSRCSWLSMPTWSGKNLKCDLRGCACPTQRRVPYIRPHEGRGAERPWEMSRPYPGGTLPTTQSGVWHHQPLFFNNTRDCGLRLLLYVVYFSTCKYNLSSNTTETFTLIKRIHYHYY